ncbi:MAG TPA: hypothetical protein VHJ76_02785 [Actinomycetota bacterium]|nr:hypothetical protein [Actinomycetota bacterium]
MRRSVGVLVATLVLGGTTFAVAQAQPDCRWVSDPGTTPDATLFGVVTSDSSEDVWAVGSSTNSRGRERTLVRHWDGSQWETQPSPNARRQSNRLNDVAIAPDGSLWAVGTRSRRTLKIVVQRYDGTAWRMRRSLNPSDELNVLDGIDVAPSGVVYAAGSRWNAQRQYRMMIQRYDGAWELVPNRMAGRLLDVDVVSDTDVWAVGTKTAGRQSHMVALHYDGTSWTETPMPDLGGTFSILNGVSAAAPDDVWAAGSYILSGGESRPVIVHYDGTEWSVADLPSPAEELELLDVAAVGPFAVAVGQNHDFDFGEDTRVVLEWDGSSWAAAEQDDELQGNDLLATDVAADGRGWAVGYHSTRPQTDYIERRTCG